MGNKQQYIIVFGVSGSGKSLVSKMLAQHLNIEFLEGDDYHPTANINKMRAGQPLTDADRVSWLKTLRAEMFERIERKKAFVLSCSALKLMYRDFFRQVGALKFIFLNVTGESALRRLETRKDHFMPASLLGSQIATLETPLPNETDVITIDALQSPEKILATIMQNIN
ncbi:MAG TPA: gluconokinase [Pelobium sp.]